MIITTLKYIIGFSLLIVLLIGIQFAALTIALAIVAGSL